MTLHITSCEERAAKADGAHSCVYCVWTDGSDADLRSCNVVADYVAQLVDGDRFVERRPDADRETAFFDVTVAVNNTHRDVSTLRVAYRRLDFSPRYNGAVEQNMEIYRDLKSGFRRGLNAHRAELAERELKRKG